MSAGRAGLAPTATETAGKCAHGQHVPRGTVGCYGFHVAKTPREITEPLRAPMQSVAPHAVASCQEVAQQVCVAKTPDGAHQVDGGLVVPGLLVADGVRDVDLEDLDAAELEPAWAPTVQSIAMPRD